MQFLKSYYICYKSFYSAVIPVVMAFKKLKKRKKKACIESRVSIKVKTGLTK